MSRQVLTRFGCLPVLTLLSHAGFELAPNSGHASGTRFALPSARVPDRNAQAPLTVLVAQPEISQDGVDPFACVLLDNHAIPYVRYDFGVR